MTLVEGSFLVGLKAKILDLAVNYTIVVILVFAMAWVASTDVRTNCPEEFGMEGDESMTTENDVGTRYNTPP